MTPDVCGRKTDLLRKEVPRRDTTWVSLQQRPTKCRGERGTQGTVPEMVEITRYKCDPRGAPTHVLSTRVRGSSTGRE